MSVIIHTRGEAGGGVAAHLHCSHCGHFSKSHAQQLSHMAAAHPSCLDEEVVGRLGTILMYQSTAHLFHCSVCFFTCKDFTKLYKHIISKHCMDHREGGDQGEEEKKVGDGEEEEEEKMGEEGEEEEKKMGEEGEEEEKKVGDGGEEEEEEKMGEEGEEKEKKMGEESEEEKEKKMGEEGEEEEEEEKMGEEGEEEEKKMGEEGEEEEKMGEEGKEEKKKGEQGEEEALRRRRSSEEEVKDEDAPPREMDSEKPDGEGEENVVTYDGSIYRCLICGCRNKLKVVSVNHVMKKHDIPKAYASQAIRRDVVTLRQTLSSTPEEDEAVGMTGELLNEEMRAMAKLVNFTSNRFVCLVCGWKTKLKGFVLSHVARSHDVERPYGCQICSSSFFLPSRLQQHVRTAHRPGRYACPFCCFRSHYLGGFRRHCSRCNAREGGEPGRAARVGGHQEHKEGEEDKKKTRAGRKRRMTRKVMEEQEEDE
ncbi:chromosome alignment-maintaining phosphoprotein 1-like [Platichthys flesus]|uniref:chromosome alignment-maintaining phosphoprotein 1-like n=1 Tax=Platichthys flesus TaxID=8260 RepID=UPI002DBA14A7|nr:chromosome alignment-maintaining phosphoprotein 1-like [Platichthys flesus]